MSYHLYVSQILCPKIFLKQKEFSFESKNYPIIGGPISTKCYICSKKGIFGLMDIIKVPINTTCYIYMMVITLSYYYICSKSTVSKNNPKQVRIGPSRAKNVPKMAFLA